jgi:hypothetical protein
MIDTDTVEQLQNDWRDPYRQWWKQIKVYFKTREDRDKFQTLVDQKLTERTNVIWHPQKDRDPNSMNRYVEDV